MLVVDDQSAMRIFLRELLTDWGFTVDLAATGEEAAAAASRCDLALVDLNMPGQGGLRTLEALARLKPGIGLVLMTGCQGVGGLAPGTRVVTKPFDLPQLRRLLTEVLADTQAAAGRAAEGPGPYPVA